MTIELVDDAVSEYNETLWFVLTNPGGATLGRDRVVAAVMDNDPTPTVSAASLNAAETGGAAQTSESAAINSGLVYDSFR